ncbi:MAG: extracellular solute-binding protein, partial [Oscillospiraceae bacterium]|nr:extracellular solute-binding protein [Oscillospiraceae bacterium]
MKKTLALILAVLMVVALFAGCGKDTTTTPTTPGTDTPASSAPSTGAEGTDTPDTPEAPVEDNGPYNFAKGKFEYNADGYVDENYSYTLPLSTTDEILTNWTTFWLPQYIPEGGMQELETLAYMEEITGVHIEYEVISSEQRSTNFSVLLASDDLRDIMDGVTFFWTSEIRDMIDDGYFINFYDYRDYMPNYLHELWARNDIDVLKYGRVDDTTWPAMYGMVVDPMPAMGYMLRQDWMDDLGLGLAKDVKTIDQFHDVLT